MLMHPMAAGLYGEIKANKVGNFLCGIKYIIMETCTSLTLGMRGILEILLNRITCRYIKLILTKKICIKLTRTAYAAHFDF